MESAVVSFPYLFVTLDVDISSLLNKVLHCANFVIESCQRQRSVLREKNIATITVYKSVILIACWQSILVSPLKDHFHLSTYSPTENIITTTRYADS